MRYFTQFSYDGTAYHGWQKQPNAISVQEVMEQCLGKLLRKPIEMVAAGRTDAGVHAKMMVAHFDSDASFDPADLVFRMNAFLPNDIAIQKVWEVANDAHARFDATLRSYEYWINIKKDPFYANWAHGFFKELKLSDMNQAAELMMSHHDFKCFSRAHTDVKTYICKISEAQWTRKDDLLVFSISADRFLRNMVRAVVGTLLEIGTSKRPISYMDEVIKSRDRSLAGASAPAKGLYLTNVVYPNHLMHE